MNPDNFFRNLEELKDEIETHLNLTLVDEEEVLGPANYKFDRHCPQIVVFSSCMRSELAKSDLIKDFKIILQDKSFCLGPATFGKLISELELSGSVIQSHVNSPRTTAYLATILAQNDKIKKLLAFSAGQR